MNILFVCEVDYAKYLVFELQELPELLSMMGHRVYVIDYESMWKKKNVLDLVSKSHKIENVVRVYPNSLVQLIHPTFVKIPLLSRLTAFFSYWSLIEKIIVEQKIDAIVQYSVPTNGLQTVYLAKKHGIPIAFCSIDILHQLVKNPLLSRITYMLEKVIYRNVDMILPRGKKLSEYVIRMGAKRSRIRVMLPGVDIAEFKPDLDVVDIRKKHNLKEQDKIVLFVGTLYKFSGLDLMVEKFGTVLQAIPNAKLLIVGAGEQQDTLKNMIERLGLSQSVIMAGLQPYNLVPYYINLADICICPFLLNGVTRDIFPIKILQYLACGKPLVCTQLLGVKEVIQGEEHGIVYVSDHAEMVDKIMWLLKSEEDRKRLGENAINYIKRVHSYDKMAKQLESELKYLIVENKK